MDLDWNTKKDGISNILKHLNEDMPKIITKQKFDEEHFPNIYNRRKFYEECIKKLEKKISWVQHNEFNIHLTTIFHLILGYSLEKVLSFANFKIKKWESTVLKISQCLNKTLIRLQQDELAKPDFEKPDPLQVKAEAEKMRSAKNISVEVTETQSLINQLGCVIKDDNNLGEMKVRINSLKLTTKIKGKTELLTFNSLEKFQNSLS